MGEIKFRVWSKKYNKIFQVKVLDLYCNETFVEHLDLGNIVLNIKNVKLMQYTGLKDKNGVEIYEGDFVYYDDYDDKFLVYWCDVYCNFRLKSKNDISINSRYDYMYKVIGNIYKNPELLDANK